jgi:hypothetical protein
MTLKDDSAHRYLAETDCLCKLSEIEPKLGELNRSCDLEMLPPACPSLRLVPAALVLVASLSGRCFELRGVPIHVDQGPEKQQRPTETKQ